MKGKKLGLKLPSVYQEVHDELVFRVDQRTVRERIWRGSRQIIKQK